MVTGSDLIVLAPWLVFGAAVSAIYARVRIGGSRARRRRAGRRPPRPGPGGADLGDRHPGEPGDGAHDRAPAPSPPGALP